MRHHPDIVKVIDDCRLIDSESYEHLYSSEYRSALSPGYYIVCWPDDVSCARFDQHARFEGPYASYAHAQQAAVAARIPE